MRGSGEQSDVLRAKVVLTQAKSQQYKDLSKLTDLKTIPIRIFFFQFCIEFDNIILKLMYKNKATR